MPEQKGADSSQTLGVTVRRVHYGFLPEVKEGLRQSFESSVDPAIELFDNSVGLGKDLADPHEPLVVSARLPRRGDRADLKRKEAEEGLKLKKLFDETGENRLYLGGQGYLHVTDFRGLGGNDQTIEQFLLKGRSERQGYGRWGLGATVAAYYLRCGVLELTAQKANSDQWHTARVEGYGDRHMPLEGDIDVITNTDREEMPFEEARFEVRLDHVPVDLLPTPQALREALADTYRPLLVTDAISSGNIVVNPTPRVIVSKEGEWQDRHDKVILEVNGVLVEPAKIPVVKKIARNELGQIVEQFCETDSVYDQTDQGEYIWFWAGQLDENHPEGQKLQKDGKTGMRLYINGRLFGIDDFGLFQEDERFKRLLVGEIHLDNVVDDLLSDTQINKSAGIRKRSEAFQRVRRFMRDALERYGILDEIGRTPVVTMVEKPDELAEAFVQAREIISITLQTLATNPAYADWFELIGGVVHGQRPPSPPGNKKNKTSVSKNEPGTPWDEQKAKTRRPAEADPKIRRKRFGGIFSNIELGPIIDPQTSQPSRSRFQVIDIESSSGEGHEKIMLINSLHPAHDLMLSIDATRWTYLEIIFRYTAEWLSTPEYSADPEERKRFFEELYFDATSAVTQSEGFIYTKLGILPPKKPIKKDKGLQ